MAQRWLLRLDLAGRSYLWSDAPCVPVDATGREWPHLGGLPELRIPSDYDPLQQVPRVQSASVEVEWPGDSDIAALLGAGHRFVDGTAELSLWEEGTAYGKRDRLIIGTPSEPEHGDGDEPVAFSVEGRPWVDAGSTHTATERVTTETWSTGDHDGEPWYPKVFGRPGWRLDAFGGMSSAYNVQSTPALVCERTSGNADRLIVAGHTVAAPQVTVSDGDTTAVLDVEHVADALGQIVATVDVSGQSTAFRTANAYTCAWTGGGGYVGAGGYISGAGDLLEWAFSRSTLPVDFGRVRAVRAYLNRFQLAGYVDEPVSPWDLITDAWLSVLPVTVVARGGKLRPVVWRYDATTTDALRTIEADAGITAPQRMVRETQQMRSSYSLACAPDVDGKNRVTVGLAATPDGLITSSRTVQRAATYTSEPEALESAWVGDLGTAYLVLRVRSIRDSSAEYVYLQDVTGEFDDLEDGDPVLVTRPGTGTTRRLGLFARDRLSTVASNYRIALIAGA